MKWKVKAGFLSAFLVAALLTAAAAAGQLEKISPRQAQMAGMFEGVEGEINYMVGEKDGFVVIFQAGFGDEPAVITDIEARTLRQGDRALLDQGIPVRTREELMMLLEDLGS